MISIPRVMEPETTALSYWLNWRFFVCAIWVLATSAFAAILIWRYEGLKKTINQPSGSHHEANGSEAWETCSESIHPVWLLSYRIVSFCVLLGLLLADAILYSVGIFYFYTQWTFALVTIYFGLGSSLSIYGCLTFRREFDSEKDSIDLERGSYVVPPLDENTDISSTNEILNQCSEPYSKTVSIWAHALQIIFQICAGAVALTDSVFWLILYPLGHKLRFLVICMHSVNALLIGDAILNRLRFPLFRFAYFILWTSAFVIFQWTIHACISTGWPYPFLDLSSPYAPVWYVAIGLVHLPAFGIFALLFRIKQRLLSV